MSLTKRYMEKLEEEGAVPDLNTYEPENKRIRELKHLIAAHECRGDEDCKCIDWRNELYGADWMNIPAEEVIL